MLEPGNVSVAAPYFLGMKSGTIAAGMAAGADFATVRNIGRANDVGTVLNVPIYVSQIRIAFASVTAFTAGGFAIEVHKATGFTVQSTTNGNARAAIQRKTSGYVAIPTTELSGYVDDTSASGVTGGTFTLVGSGATPIHVAAAGGSGTLPAIQSVWTPSDLCPLVLEANEGLVFRNLITMAAGTGVFFAAVDFLRQ
jgi:hypothetical protein